MALDIVGTWEPYARQAAVDYPVHPMKKNAFATLEIKPDGTGIARRKALFTNSVEEISWTEATADSCLTCNPSGPAYFIHISDLFTLQVIIDGNEMGALVTDCFVSANEGMVFYFKRV